MNNFDDILNSTPEQEQNGGEQLSKEDWAAKKKAERDDVFELTNNIAYVASTDSATLRNFLDVQSRFDRYSAVNALLILTQKPNAVRLGDFDYWKNQNASVKSQEKGISILEPHEYTREDGSPGIGYNVKKVFDVSQVQASKLKAEPVPPTYTDRQILQALVYKAPVQITSSDNLDGKAEALTDPDTGAITVLKGMEFSDTFRGLSKELALAQSRGNQVTRIDPDFSAYCVSYLLCKKHGVGTNDFDFSDVGKVFENLDTQERKAEFQIIRNAFADISGRMNKHLESLQKNARNNEAR